MQRLLSLEEVRAEEEGWFINANRHPSTSRTRRSSSVVILFGPPAKALSKLALIVCGSLLPFPHAVMNLAARRGNHGEPYIRQPSPSPPPDSDQDTIADATVSMEPPPSGAPKDSACSAGASQTLERGSWLHNLSKEGSIMTTIHLL